MGRRREKVRQRRRRMPIQRPRERGSNEPVVSHADTLTGRRRPHLGMSFSQLYLPLALMIHLCSKNQLIPCEELLALLSVGMYPKTLVPRWAIMTEESFPGYGRDVVRLSLGLTDSGYKF